MKDRLWFTFFCLLLFLPIGFLWAVRPQYLNENVDPNEVIKETNRIVETLSGGLKIVQIVTSTTTPNFTTTSTSFVATTSTATITLLKSTNKILVMAMGVLGSNTANVGGEATLFRDSTNLFGGTNATALATSASGTVYSTATMFYLDSPNTTSSITYNVYVRSTGSGTETIFWGAGRSCITMLIELQS